MAQNWYARRQLRSFFDAFRISLNQNRSCEKLYSQKIRLKKRDVLQSWRLYMETRRRAAYLLGKLFSMSRRSDMRPAFQRLQRVDVTLNAEQIVNKIKAETNKVVKNEEQRDAVVIVSMSRAMTQNYRANMSNSLRRWLHACRRCNKQKDTTGEQHCWCMRLSRRHGTCGDNMSTRGNELGASSHVLLIALKLMVGNGAFSVAGTHLQSINLRLLHGSMQPKSLRLFS